MESITEEEFLKLGQEKANQVTWFKEVFWNRPLVYAESFTWEGISEDRPPFSGPRTRFLFDGKVFNRLENCNFISDITNSYKNLGSLTRLVKVYQDYSIIKIIKGKDSFYFKGSLDDDFFQLSLGILKEGIDETV